MLQKYYPILSKINSPLAALVALGFTAAAAEVAIKGISNEVLETLLKEAVSSTAVYKKEVEISASELAAARVAAKKELKAARYRAAQAARSARRISKLSRQVKASKRPPVKNSLKGLSGLALEDCRQKAVEVQVSVRVATNNYNAALEAVELAVNKGGDIRVIRSSVAALKAAVRTLEVRHVELRFAREMLAISLDRHSA